MAGFTGEVFSDAGPPEVVGTPPTISIADPSGGVVGTSDVVRVEAAPVAADSVNILRVAIAWTDDVMEEVYDSVFGFSPKYTGPLNVVSNPTPSTTRVELNRDGGWLSRTGTIYVTAVDGDGNETTTSSAFSFTIVLPVSLAGGSGGGAMGSYTDPSWTTDSELIDDWPRQGRLPRDYVNVLRKLDQGIDPTPLVFSMPRMSYFKNAAFLNYFLNLLLHGATEQTAYIVTTQRFGLPAFLKGKAPFPT